MALQKQPVNINFGTGLDLKTDPYQVPAGRFLTLQNAVFDKGGQLKKRNGFAKLKSLPDTSNTYVTTFNDNLTAIGTSFNAFSSGSNSWINKGAFNSVQLDTLPLIRTNTNQSQADAVVSSNNFVCTVYTDNVPSGSTTVPEYKYAIADATTGQNIIAPTVIPVTSGTIVSSPKVFLLGNFFVIVFVNHVVSYDLQYIAVSTQNPTIVTTNVTVSAQVNSATPQAFDCLVVNNNLYFAWNGSDGGGAIRTTYIDFTLAQHNTVAHAGQAGDMLSLAADLTFSPTATIYVSYYKNSSKLSHVYSMNPQQITILAPTQITSIVTIENITSVADDGLFTFFYEVQKFYSYDGAIQTDYISSVTCTHLGVVGTPSVVIRSVGLASKAILDDGTIYFLVVYSSDFQPTYFLVDSLGDVLAKVAYSNGGGYLTLGLPSLTLNDGILQVAYLIKDLIEPVNKDQGAVAPAGIYSQTGINLVSFDPHSLKIDSSEIGNNLNLSGGFLWMYDGYLPVEQGFFVWPDNVEASTSTTGGFLEDQQYFYQVTYEWSDNQGNVFRSAPSIPLEVTTAGGNTSSNTIFIPTLRLTYKIANPVKIVIYRWSTAQQNYYQVTSLAVPLLNDPTIDSVQYVDKLADSSIIGNALIYTTGGVVENIGPPATSVMALFQSRLFLVDAEDKNLLWYSKQVIENTPVEMSDLFTIFIAPTTASQGSTGPIRALAAMDDKLIIFKKDAIYYLNGVGPDNTGANNQFSEPIFITSTVGCENQQSIVFIPSGLMFQSDKGIWLLGRDLSTQFIGVQVEPLSTEQVVESAVNIPGTNQVRFTMDSGITLMYDYYFQQWGTFVNIPSISSTLYQSMHTYINSRGEVFQEAENRYLDGSSPVLMNFTTSWIKLTGLQGYQRAYYFYILGTYISPHKLNIQIAYDFAPAPSQGVIITPDNFTGVYGSDPLYGDSETYGGALPLEQWRVFLNQQKCESFQISMTEVFDATMGIVAGAGLTMSGLNMVIGTKKGYPVLKPSRSIG